MTDALMTDDDTLDGDCQEWTKMLGERESVIIRMRVDSISSLH